MIDYRPGDLVLIGFPFSSGTQGKQRPALVILDSGDADVLVARVTTQIYETLFDVLIAEWQGAGLLAPSVVRIHKLAAIEKALIRRGLGQLRPPDRQRVAAVLSRAFADW